jgi:nucleotide-binding universal stress UspA family protein
MFATALVALDISPAEGPMIDCLSDLRAWGVARVVLVHVVKVGYVQGAGYGRRDDYVAWLEDRAAPLRAGGLEVAVEVRAAGLPAEEILAAAAETGARLIVIGSRGQNMARELFLGSTAREVLRRSSLPVLLEWIEPSAEDTAARCELVCGGPLRRVIVATDFSRHARAAEAVAIGIGPRADGVDAVHVMADGDAARFPAWPVMARAGLEDLAARISAAGGWPEVHLLSGVPAEQIARLAEERQASLIVTGKHGRNWIESMVIGSTAARLCEIARRPVLMVPLAGDPAQRSDPSSVAGPAD